MVRVSLKVTLEGEHRRVALKEVTMKEVERVVAAMYNMSKNEYVLSYVDEEGDKIVVASDLELEECLELSNVPNLIRLNLEKKGPVGSLLDYRSPSLEHPFLAVSCPQPFPALNISSQPHPMHPEAAWWDFDANEEEKKEEVKKEEVKPAGLLLPFIESIQALPSAPAEEEVKEEEVKEEEIDEERAAIMKILLSFGFEEAAVKMVVM
uniref:PB1 domain-containing protein n=1 Tax=Paramoeba aestuarina TaxID=180227 RepID=A0A7S4U8J1_9EUKA|mmetsp:Transcript_34610/g.54043  ORF Transcript_34610/g.54043 Transcript_34610/m.54043 type:complete len:208 (+) Transcript_34610:150-773(+)|eukprot:CAMPEP_0201507198 /NCGR_PEP_ID=MMETSP0161_2-20130828/935_1 /ASSEMBLY_ACC=CAM_ASM_000251 /TAXON_ID=180227 /ORGANISM="Neoparamoeba aestuarina, Strain SoJaBio B1-5/56/2" /LENGTH=207 /DNA_ID=CAMNT_0047901497 /DNA_START=117 /DNA_END=740 /DNA_ORIENTATION=+